MELLHIPRKSHASPQDCDWHAGRSFSVRSFPHGSGPGAGSGELPRKRRTRSAIGSPMLTVPSSLVPTASLHGGSSPPLNSPFRVKTASVSSATPLASPSPRRKLGFPAPGSMLLSPRARGPLMACSMNFARPTSSAHHSDSPPGDRRGGGTSSPPRSRNQNPIYLLAARLL